MLPVIPKPITTQSGLSLTFLRSLPDSIIRGCSIPPHGHKVEKGSWQRRTKGALSHPPDSAKNCNSAKAAPSFRDREYTANKAQNR